MPGPAGRQPYRSMRNRTAAVALCAAAGFLLSILPVARTTAQPAQVSHTEVGHRPFLGAGVLRRDHGNDNSTDNGGGNLYRGRGSRTPGTQDIRPQAATRTGGIVAVLDTGIVADHEWLRDRILPGASFIPTEPDTTDLNGHGTHVAGIIALGAPDAIILPVKVLDRNGWGSDLGVADGIVWAMDNGANVINLSLGAPGAVSWVLAEALAEAERRGVIVVAAAGNDGVHAEPHYPAAVETVLATTATDMLWQETEFDQAGEYIDIAAPGKEIYSAYAGGYGYLSGTSMSTPAVSAAAARLRALQPTWSAAEIRNHLLATSEDVGEPGRDRIFGWGLVRTDRATTTPGPLTPETSHRTNAYRPQLGKTALTLRPIHPGTRFLEVEALKPDGITRLLVRSERWQLLHDEPGKYRVRAFDKTWNMLGSSIVTIDVAGRVKRAEIKPGRRSGGWLAMRTGDSRVRNLVVLAVDENGHVVEEITELRTGRRWIAVQVESGRQYRVCYLGVLDQLHGCSKTSPAS
jgi:hypothetical protein